MIVGTTIFYFDGTRYYSPEFPRGGLAGRFSVDVTHYAVSGAAQLDIIIQSRNSEDTTFGDLGTIGITGTGVATVDVLSVQEIVRLAFNFSGGSPAASDAVHLLVQPPSWRPY